MGETISMSLFSAGRRATIEPLSRTALDAILKDEVRHQQLGWDALTDLYPHLPQSERARLQHEATTALAAFEQTVALPALRYLEAGEPFSPALSELGVLAPEARVDAFYKAIESFVIPRLTALGLDGPRAWADRYRAGTPNTGSTSS
jgi:hypothetical protein